MTENAMDLDELLGSVTRLLDAVGARWALIGGLALSAYGVGRPTADVDLVVDLERQTEILELLETKGFETLHASRGYSNHLRGRDRVDLVYVEGETAGRIFSGVRTLSTSGRDVYVVKPEHLAAMKVLAMKNDPERRVGELADIQQLLKLPEVDRDSIRIQFERHGLEDFYRQLVETL